MTGLSEADANARRAFRDNENRAKIERRRFSHMVRSFVFVRAAVILAVSVFAYPQTATASGPLPIPFTVDSEFLDYSKDGTPQIDMYATSFQHNRREVILSSSLPGKPFVNTVRRLIDVTSFLFFEATLPLRADAERDEEVAARRSTEAGCRDGWPVVRAEPILGYETTVTQFSNAQQKITMWRAPNLGCFLMKFSMEEKREDGAFHIVKSRRALKVTINK